MSSNSISVPFAAPSLGPRGAGLLLRTLRSAVICICVALSACGGSEDEGGATAVQPAAVPSFAIMGATPQVELGTAMQLASDISPDTAGLAYRWDFGDGSGSVSPNPTKVYTASGAYAVSLTITGAAGDVRAAAINVVAGRFSLAKDLRCTGASPGSGWCRVVYPPRFAFNATPFFVDANNGWVIGDQDEYEGVVLRTTDGGQSWAPHRVGVKSMFGLAFGDVLNGYVIGSGNNFPEVWGTSDGGLTWARRGVLPVGEMGSRFSGDTVYPITVSHAGQRVVVLRRTLGLQISQDGGVTWTTTALPGVLTPSGTLFQLDGPRVLRSTSLDAGPTAIKLSDAGTLLKIAFSSDSNGWIYGSNDGVRPSVWRTRDGGLTWTRNDVATTNGRPTLRPLWLEAYGPDTLWLTDESPFVFGTPVTYRSNDGGLTWRHVVPPESLRMGRPASPVNVVNDRLAYSVLCNKSNSVAVTEDGGGTWTVLTLTAPGPTSNCLEGVLLPGASTATPLVRVGGFRNEVFYRSGDGGASWTQVLGLTPAQAPPGMGSVWFHDALHRDGLTETTADGGRTWTPKTALFGTDNGINVHYGSGGLGWAAPSNLSSLDVYRTTDYGQTWTKGTLPPAGGLLGFGSSAGWLHFINDREGWLLRDGYNTNVTGVTPGRAIWSTTDGGSTWVGLGTGPALTSPAFMRFINATTGYVTEQNGGIAQTKDGGRTWQTLPTPVTGFGQLYFFNEMLGWSLGRNGLLRTTDGGATWSSVAVPVPRGTDGYSFGAIRFADERTGWIVGAQGLVLATNDGGLTWTSQDSGTLAALVGVYATDARTAWAVDWRGRPLYTATGGNP